MSELHERLAEISRLQGKEVPDGRSIMGDTQTPWPAWSPREPVRPTMPDEVGEPEGFDDPLEVPRETSPLVEIAQPRPLPAPPVAPPAFPVPKVNLLVIDGVGGYQGHETLLSEGDQNQIAGIILRAIQRTVQEKLSGLPKGRRVRKRSEAKPVKGVEAASPEVVPGQKPPDPVRRKPGRPKKVTA